MHREYLIKALSDPLRKKHKNLNLGVMQREKLVETTFKPVVGPLQDKSNELKQQSSTTTQTGIARNESIAKMKIWM